MNATMPDLLTVDVIRIVMFGKQYTGYYISKDKDKDKDEGKEGYKQIK